MTTYRYFDGKELISIKFASLYQKFLSIISAQPLNNKNELVKKLRLIFSVKPFAEGGLTELELFDLCSHFINFRTYLLTQ